MLQRGAGNRPLACIYSNALRQNIASHQHICKPPSGLRQQAMQRRALCPRPGETTLRALPFALNGKNDERLIRDGAKPHVVDNHSYMNINILRERVRWPKKQVL